VWKQQNNIGHELELVVFERFVFKPNKSQSKQAGAKWLMHENG
jgi:hypothetical protein